MTIITQWSVTIRVGKLKCRAAVCQVRNHKWRESVKLLAFPCFLIEQQLKRQCIEKNLGQQNVMFQDKKYIFDNHSLPLDKS